MIAPKYIHPEGIMERNQEFWRQQYLKMAEKYRRVFVDPDTESPGLESQLVPENYQGLADNIAKHYLKLLDELSEDPEVHVSRKRRIRTALDSGDTEIIATIFGVEMLVNFDPQLTFFLFTEVIREQVFAPGNPYEAEGEDSEDAEPNLN